MSVLKFGPAIFGFRGDRTITRFPAVRPCLEIISRHSADCCFRKNPLSCRYVRSRSNARHIVKRAFIILGEQLMRVIVILANGGWPDGGCGSSRSRFVFIQGSIRARTRGKALEQMDTRLEFRGRDRRGDRPSRPDVADTSQVTQRD